MKRSFSFPAKKTRASTLIAVMIVITVIAILSGSVLDYSWHSWSMARRQHLLEQTKLTAENEMEFLYFRWKSQILAMTPAAGVPAALLASTPAVTVDRTTLTTTAQTPFLPDATSWTTARSLDWDVTLPSMVPGTSRTGNVSYFTARTRAFRYHPTYGIVQYQLGRRFAYSLTSLFQYSVFYQGELEINTASDMTIKGDISSNSDVYLTSVHTTAATPTLTIADKVYYGPGGATYNGGTDSTSGTQLYDSRSTGTSTPNVHPPSFDPTPDDHVAPSDQVAQRYAQVEKMAEAENFLGGIDVETVLANDTNNAYGENLPVGMTDATQIHDWKANNVYRAVIAPPPSVAEDQVVASSRMHNRSALIIKIDGGTVTVTNPTDTLDPTHDYYSDSNATIRANFQAAIAGSRTAMTDRRENRVVQVTDIDVSALNTAINGVPSLKNAYTGVVYVYDTSTADGAVRLVNGQLTPNFNNKGFILATDNGLYVKGDYNTTYQTYDSGTNQGVATPLGSGGTKNRAALMSDAITVLSNSWQDSNSAGALNTRKANSNFGVVGAKDANVGFVSDNATTIVAAIVSGNTPTSSTSSGGVQNLVRYLEDWYNGASVTGPPPRQEIHFWGSLGQLFSSVYFNSPYRSNGSANGVFQIPYARSLEFDNTLASNPPGGAPTTTTFSRGDYFIWYNTP